MNCQYCNTNHRKFYCVDCIKEKLQKHAEEINTIRMEKDQVVAKAEVFLEQASVIQNLLAVKNRHLKKLDSIRDEQKHTESRSQSKAQRIKELKNEIRDKRRLLQESLKRKSQMMELQTVNATFKAWQRTHKMTVGTRRILVKEISSLFELKPGLIEEQVEVSAKQVSSDDLPAFSTKTSQLMEQDLYICGVTLPTRLIDVSKYPKEELNAPIGLVIHMLGLIVKYLGIKLPFEFIKKGVRPYIKTPNKQHVRKFPLYLEEDDKNFKKFLHGMSMLNYNIIYICHTQGVKIQPSQLANTLQGLLLICKAPLLGYQSHALYYQHIRDLNCPIDYDQVLRATTLRYRCSSSIVHHDVVTTNNELHDDFFKIHSHNQQHLEKAKEEEEEEEEYSLYLDSEEDEEGREQDKEIEPENEAWSLVEVAPFLISNNNNVVHNMIESLSGNNSPINHSPIASTIDSYWIPRKKKT